MMGRLLGVVLSRGVWIFLGLLALCYVIWVAGAALAINQWYPLETPTSRLALIAFILGVYFLRLIWRKWREGRLNAQLLRQLRQPTAPSSKDSSVDSPEALELRKRFDEAIDLLKDTRFQADQGAHRWRRRLDRQYLYQLPWYVFIGAPGSGKTTALVNAGLHFPLAEKFGKSALKGVGGTRHCDWWFTDEAVLLDTAGRYTTHESDPRGDEKEWHEFLQLLSRYRGRQPINGVILTVSVSDLLGMNDTDRAEHAAVLRQRLHELRKQLGIQFPVYVLVSKMDLLGGFSSYFQHLDREALEQVWGFSFPYDQSQQLEFDFLSNFQQEYRLLQQILEDGLATVLGQLSSEQDRAAAFMLPQQFAALRDVLGYFLAEVFASSRLDPYLPPRGVYFSSGTQVGEPLDPVGRAVGKDLHLDAAVSPSSSGPGKSFFLHDVLKRVVFQEAGLAGLNMAWERRYRHWRYASYLGIGALLVGLSSWWLLSYQQNQHYLEQVEARVPELDQLGKQTVLREGTEVLALMPYLNANWDLAAGDDFYPPERPLSYGAGLYQGNKIQAASSSKYEQVLQEQLWPQVVRLIEQRLAHAQAQDLEQQYEALRAYLMLYDAQRYDPVFLSGWVLRALQPELPEHYTRAQYQRLSMHVKHLLSTQVRRSPYARNDELIQQARERLDQYGLAQRVYSRLLRLHTNQAAKDISLIALAGAEASSIFERVSQGPLNEGVPSLYSYQGYWNDFAKQVEGVTDQLHRDDAWILNVDQRTQQPRASVLTEVRRLYLSDYVRYWDEFLADVRVRRPQNLIDAIELSRSLSAAQSPLGRFVRRVAAETSLLREDDQQQRSIIDRAKDKVSSSTQSLEQMFGPIGLDKSQRDDTSAQRQEEVVDRHFRRYHELAQSPGAGVAPPLDSTLALLNELYTYLTAADSALRSQSPLPPGDVLSKLQAESGRMPEAVGHMLQDLSSASGQVVNQLRQAQLGEDVQAVLGAYCQRTIAGRYPFSAKGHDVAPNDFARFFGPQQMMEQFFDRELAALVDRSGTQLRFKPGIDGRQGQSSRYLRSFEQAAVIRDVFFMAGQSQPRFQLAVRVVDMDASINQMSLDIDGQTLTYAHGPSLTSTVTWPGERGSHQVQLSLMPLQGRSSMSAQGPWALHRLLDAAVALEKGPSPEITLARYDLDGRQLTLEFRSYSALSPFNLAQLRSFTCPVKG